MLNYATRRALLKEVLGSALIRIVLSDGCFILMSAPQSRNQPSVRHLYACDHGIGQVHMRQRDGSAEQLGYHRHEHAHAAVEEADHGRLGFDESQCQDPRSERFLFF